MALCEKKSYYKLSLLSILLSLLENNLVIFHTSPARLDNNNLVEMNFQFPFRLDKPFILSSYCFFVI